MSCMPGVLQDPGADLRVAAHLPPFRLVQGARLLQDRVGDAELAEIVQDAGGVDALDVRLGEAERRSP